MSEIGMARAMLQTAFTVMAGIGAIGFFLGVWPAFDGWGWLNPVGILGMAATGVFKRP